MLNQSFTHCLDMGPYEILETFSKILMLINVDDLRVEWGAKIVFYYVIYDLYKESTPIG